MHTKYIEVVYGYLRTLGDVGDTFTTDVHPWLKKAFDMDDHEAYNVRDWVMKELIRQGRVEHPPGGGHGVQRQRTTILR